MSRLAISLTGLKIDDDDEIVCSGSSLKFVVVGMRSGYLHVLSIGGHHCASVLLDGCSPVGISVFPNDEVLVASKDLRVFIIEPWEPSILRVDAFPELQSISAVAIPHQQDHATYILAALSKDTPKLIRATFNLFGFKKFTSTPITTLATAISPGSLFSAWASEDTLEISDPSMRSFFSLERPEAVTGDIPGISYPARFPVQIDRLSDSRLFIAWADAVQTLDLLEGQRVRLSSTFQLSEYWIFGFSVRSHFIVIAAVEKGKGRDGCWDTANVLICDGKGVVVDRCEVEIDGKARLSDLGFQVCDSRSSDTKGVSFFIVTSRKAFLVKLRGTEDVIRELISSEQIEKALEIADFNQLELKEFSFDSMLCQCFDHLVDTKDFAKAAEVCIAYAREDEVIWEKCITALCDFNCVHLIALQIPTQFVVLDSFMYTRVLKQLLDLDYEMFAQCVTQWPTDIYDSEVLYHLIRQLDQTDSSEHLAEALAHLSISQRHLGTAIEAYSTMRKAVFDKTELGNRYVHVTTTPFDTPRNSIGTRDEEKEINKSTVSK